MWKWRKDEEAIIDLSVSLVARVVNEEAYPSFATALIQGFLWREWTGWQVPRAGHKFHYQKLYSYIEVRLYWSARKSVEREASPLNKHSRDRSYIHRRSTKRACSNILSNHLLLPIIDHHTALGSQRETLIISSRRIIPKPLFPLMVVGLTSTISLTA